MAINQPQAQSDYYWLSQNLPADIGHEFKARFFDLGINAGYIAATATQSASAGREAAPQQRSTHAKQQPKRTPATLTSEKVMTELKRYPTGIEQATLAKRLKANPSALSSVLRGMKGRGIANLTDGKWFASAQVTELEQPTQRRTHPQQAPANTAAEQEQRTGTNG